MKHDVLPRIYEKVFLIINNDNIVKLKDNRILSLLRNKKMVVIYFYLSSLLVSSFAKYDLAVLTSS